MKKQKILLLNQGHTTNYGDIAIHNTIETFLNEQNLETAFYPFWSEENVFGKKYNNYSKKIKKMLFKYSFIIDLFNKLSIKKHIKNIHEFDSIVIGGGELISSHKGFNSSLKVWANLSQKYNIPLYIIGVSGDLNMSKKMLSRNKNSLSKASLVCVRDHYSHKIFTDFYNVNTICMTDVVFAYNHLIKKTSQPKTKKNELLFVHIEFNKTIKKNLNLENENKYIKYLFNIMNKNLNNTNIVTITTSVKDDEKLAEKFYKYAKENNNNDNITFNYQPYSNINEYIKLLNKSQKVISARMHALILALLNNCEISVIPFKEKLITFEKEYSKNINLENTENIALNELNLLYKLIKNQEYEENVNSIKELLHIPSL